eukprot:4571250-Alexandrium_andersonii.AAC.1
MRWSTALVIIHVGTQSALSGMMPARVVGERAWSARGPPGAEEETPLPRAGCVTCSIPAQIAPQTLRRKECIGQTRAGRMRK